MNPSLTRTETVRIGAGKSGRAPLLSSQKIRTDPLPGVDEGRKRVLLIAASILVHGSSRSNEPGKHVSATMFAVADAIRWAED